MTEAKKTSKAPTFAPPNVIHDAVPANVVEEVAGEVAEAFEIEPKSEVAVVLKSDDKRVIDTWLVRLDENRKVEIVQRQDALSENPEELVANGDAKWVSVPSGWSASALERKYASAMKFARVEKSERILRVLVWDLISEKSYSARACVEVSKD